MIKKYIISQVAKLYGLNKVNILLLIIYLKMLIFHNRKLKAISMIKKILFVFLIILESKLFAQILM